MGSKSRSAVGAGLLSVACVLILGACGGSSGGSSGSAGTSSSAGSTSTGGNASSGGSGTITSGGDAGEAGAGESTPIVAPSKPHAASATVAGGTVAHSVHFTGVFSLGEAPGGNGIHTGKNTQLRSGVIGASQ
ncbi:MAG TPA: hypothetical protein VGM44_23140 [Polyangiaceae bacterium]